MKYIETVGKRKTAVARVRISDAAKEATFVVNGKKLEDYFKKIEKHIQKTVDPLEKTATNGKFDVSVKVIGGGVAAQAEAIRHGISRALVERDPEARKVLKPLGYLTRDSREVERKKFGHKKARRSPQWSKR